MLCRSDNASPCGPLSSPAPAVFSSLGGVRRRSLGLVFLLWTGCVHPDQSATPMHPTCLELPVVEECLAASRVITDGCLRKCVELQCSGVKVNCHSETIRKSCEEKTNRAEGSVALGYVDRFSDTPTSCDKPFLTVNWCEEPASRDCRAKAMVHELAHSCGWRHGQGFNVPGDNGFLQCE
jgi:hypothetical protein